MAGDPDRPTHPQPQSIEGIARLSRDQLGALQSRWITTIDSFVGVASSAGGRAGLCAVLGVDPEGLDDLLEDARVVLGETRYRELRKSKPGGPMGALLVEDRPSVDGSEGVKMP